MADVHTKEQRSRNMTAIRSRGNRSTEGTLLSILKENHITGWRRHYKRLKGTPDFVFPKKKVAVFIDGCFWHGCPRCKLHSKSNVKFWKEKINNNKRRDKDVNKSLKLSDWSVLRIWEHQLVRTPSITTGRVINLISNQRGK